ncbi:hypothetical protein [Saccharopolyspora sp. NPDC050642]|uniref:hypothetical protein n=1 Tax=Saccharopolyspora sp. NPDC050642 TaxID=3157099 RepID=UPI003409534E
MLLVLLAVPFLRESRGASGSKVDWAGTSTFVAGLFLLMLGVVEGPQWGWGSPGVLGLLAGSVLLMVLFVLVERRQRHPMFDLALLRSTRFVALCLIRPNPPVPQRVSSTPSGSAARPWSSRRPVRRWSTCWGTGSATGGRPSTRARRRPWPTA